MAYDFTQVTMGTGDVTFTGAKVGYIDTFKFKYADEIIEKFYTVEGGGSYIRGGAINFKKSLEFEISFAQLSVTNFSYCLGGLTPVAVAGVEVDKTIAFETVTAQLNMFGGTYVSKMGATANMITYVTITAASVALINVAETVPYVEGDDYIVDYSTGLVIWNPAGTNFANLVGDSYVIHQKYKYTPTASNRLDLGKAYAQVTYEIKFVQVNPQTLLQTEIVMWKGVAKPEFELEYVDTDTVSMVGTWLATDDTANHPTNPYGYVLVQ